MMPTQEEVVGQQLVVREGKANLKDNNRTKRKSNYDQPCL